jgi:biopolymer transport protein ExbD
MLAALAMQNLHSLPVNLPTGNAEPLIVNQPLTLTVTRDGQLLLNEDPVTVDTLAAAVAPRLPPDHAVIVNADAEAPNGIVVQAMLAARTAGAEKFLFAIRKK